MRKLMSVLFKSRKERKIDHILQKIAVKETKISAKCICEMKGVSGYCHEHRTDWI